VTSNEPVNNKEPDFTVSGEGLQPRVVALRAERLGQGDGRVYSIAATASDIADNVAHATGMCTVPHDQGTDAAPSRAARHGALVAMADTKAIWRSRV
jgi:hypothetical protein